jgi:hypothetical protein
MQPLQPAGNTCPTAHSITHLNRRVYSSSLSYFCLPSLRIVYFRFSLHSWKVIEKRRNRKRKATWFGFIDENILQVKAVQNKKALYHLFVELRWQEIFT